MSSYGRHGYSTRCLCQTCENQQFLLQRPFSGFPFFFPVFSNIQYQQSCTEDGENQSDRNAQVSEDLDTCNPYCQDKPA